MENTLKVTNVLSDPTRFNIYQHILQHRKEVSVLDIAKEFEIHPNVARLHLSKLEDIDLVTSSFLKTGKGGRPSRIYKLSDKVIELNFPYRDYKLLASIALETFVQFGEQGKMALYETGRKYGLQIVLNNESISSDKKLPISEKIQILEDMGTMLGMYPKFDYDKTNNRVIFEIQNCPFREIAKKDSSTVCHMHKAFLEGMFAALFTEVELVEVNNAFQGCNNCSYVANLSIV